MKLSRITRHALTASFGAVPGTLILLWVLLNYGHEAFMSSYALLTAWVIQGVMIFAFMGEGSPKEDRPLEGNTEGHLGIVCGQCGLPRPEDQVGIMIGCLRCGNLLSWKLVGNPAQVQSEEGESGDE